MANQSRNVLSLAQPIVDINLRPGLSATFRHRNESVMEVVTLDKILSCFTLFSPPISGHFSAFISPCSMVTQDYGNDAGGCESLNFIFLCGTEALLIPSRVGLPLGIFIPTLTDGFNSVSKLIVPSVKCRCR